MQKEVFLPVFLWPHTVCTKFTHGLQKFAHWLQKVCKQFKIYQQFVSIKIKVLVGLRAPPGCIPSRQTQFQCLAVKLYFYPLGLPMTISVCKWADDVSWPMNSWGQFANEKLISVCQWSADISLTMSCWCYVGQWAAGISWPINSWCKLANMQLTLVGWM